MVHIKSETGLMYYTTKAENVEIHGRNQSPVLLIKNLQFSHKVNYSNHS